MLPRVDFIVADENKWLLLNSPDHITDFIRRNGFWGHTEASIAKAFLANRKAPNVLDIGANIGGFTLPIAQYISNNNGKVFAFEPQRIVFQQLCANIFSNRLDNVWTFNNALGNENCKILIPELDCWKSHNMGGFSIDENIRNNLAIEAKAGLTFANSESGINHEIEQKTLDSFQFSFDVSLIKVDVEGFELEVFRGGMRTISSNNFPPIIFELWENKHWYDQKAEQTKNILADWGYRFHQFGREILAQHPNHPVQCKVTKNSDKINLSILQSEGNLAG